MFTLPHSSRGMTTLAVVSTAPIATITMPMVLHRRNDDAELVTCMSG